MSILGKLKSQSAPAGAAAPEPTIQLTKQEIEFLLTILKDVSIRGEHVETFYNIILKLQEQYLKQ
jgi:hypothetical protein